MSLAKKAKDKTEVRNARILSWILVLVALPAMIWTGYSEMREINTLLDVTSAPIKNISNESEIGGISLTKSQLPIREENKVVRYVTVKELSYLASQSHRAEIVSKNYGYSKMIGLESFPSFLVKEKDVPFWRSQFYLEIILNYGSFAVLVFILFAITEINLKQQKKLFTKEIKYTVIGLVLGVYLVFFLKAILYGRMISYLNKEYLLGESLVGGISQEIQFIGLALLFLLFLLEKGIPMQQEQDLTV